MAINARIFSEIVRKLPDSEIVIETQERPRLLLNVRKQSSISLYSRAMNSLICRLLRRMILLLYPNLP